MLTGDLDQAGEKTIIKAMRLPQVDILKFGHHGSKTSTSSQLLETVRPSYGIVSAGRDNRFGHPHPQVLAKAAHNKIQVLSTAQEGLLLLKGTNPVRWQTECGFD